MALRINFQQLSTSLERIAKRKALMMMVVDPMMTMAMAMTMTMTMTMAMAMVERRWDLPRSLTHSSADSMRLAKIVVRHLVSPSSSLILNLFHIKSFYLPPPPPSAFSF